MIQGRARRVAITLEQCWHAVPGGTARAAIDSAAALLRYSDLDLVGVSARHGDPPSPPWVPPIPVRMLPLPRRALYETWHGLRWPSVQRATGPVDVVHVTGMAMPPRRGPTVVTVHDLAFLGNSSLATRHGMRFFRRAIELAKKDADVVIAPSQATIDDCIANGFEVDRLRLVPWGIEVVPATDVEVRATLQAHDLDRPFVLWAGTIEPRKNLPALVRAFAALGRDDLDLVLAGPSGWNEDLDALVATVPGRVRPLGFVSTADLRALYAGAEVFCYPSIREGFGLPVLEAMAQGAVVITSAGTATAEVLGDAGLLIDPDDSDDLRDALDRALGDENLRAELRARAHRRASTFTWQHTAALLEASYDDAIRTAR